jgi:hypothetical protein
MLVYKSNYGMVSYSIHDERCLLPVQTETPSLCNNKKPFLVLYDKSRMRRDISTQSREA